MKKIYFLLISIIIINFSLENKTKVEERLLPLACERIVESFKKFGNLDKLDEAIFTLFKVGIVDQYTESISKWLASYQFNKYQDTFIRIINLEKEDFFRTAHYEYVTEDIFRETIKNYL